MDAPPSMKLQLITFIRSMYVEGIVNDHFLRLQAIKTSNDAVIRAIVFYYLESKKVFTSLTDLIEHPGDEVDFELIDELATDFYGKSCEIGAETVRCLCAELIRASRMKDKKSCSEVLYLVKNRFSYLRRRLETVVQMERNIIYNEENDN